MKKTKTTTARTPAALPAVGKPRPPDPVAAAPAGGTGRLQDPSPVVGLLWRKAVLGGGFLLLAVCADGSEHVVRSAEGFTPNLN